MRLIAFTGAIGSGKSSACEMIIKVCRGHFHAPVIICNFADVLKSACYAIFGGDFKNYFGSQEDKAAKAHFWEKHLGEKYSTYRRILQTVGTDIFRKKVHRNFWVLAMQRGISEIRRDYPDAIILLGDLRFDNEAQMVRDMGGWTIETIKGKRHVLTMWQKIKRFFFRPHKSEHGVSKHLILHTIEAKDRVELLAQVKRLLRDFKVSHDENFAE